MLMSIRSAKHLGRTSLAAVLITTAAATSASCADIGTSTQATRYCAILSDSIGLYVGNPVTLMGYAVGTVDSITPNLNDVRVDFSVREQRPLASNVKAIIRSTSLLADRSLELVGNYDGSGPVLKADTCIPRDRTFTPKSLSDIIGAATNFVNSINPSGSTNVGDVVHLLDQATHNNGAGINQLLRTSSSVADSPDQSVADMASIVTNVAQLTTQIDQMRGPLKEVLLDAQATTPNVTTAVGGGLLLIEDLPPFITLLSDLETRLGDQTQLTLDIVGAQMRKMTPHANRLANLLNPVPWWINTLANHVNNRQLSIRYRPPMYRIHTPDGLAMCGIMNAQMPGSCADVAGQPYAVDVSLLQYVLQLASR
jgi:phospholipid/cholesterol/gamma-HCH transport system substrate-binding protein